MTQEYTPTTDLVRSAWVEQTRKGGAQREFKRILAGKEFDRWLAVHDREVAAKALKLTDRELAIMEAAYDQSLEEWEGDGLGAMSVGLKAVAKYRKEREQ